MHHGLARPRLDRRRGLRGEVSAAAFESLEEGVSAAGGKAGCADSI